MAFRSLMKARIFSSVALSVDLSFLFFSSSRTIC